MNYEFELRKLAAIVALLEAFQDDWTDINFHRCSAMLGSAIENLRRVYQEISALERKETANGR